MQTLQIDPQAPDQRTIDEAAEVLRSGGVIIYPTDTCYGIGCDPAIPEAVAKIYAMKQRDLEKANSVIVRDFAQLERFSLLTLPIEQLLRQYLPGPYSFLLQNADHRICPLNAVMIRMPDYPVTQALAAAFAAPFTTTSANYQGEPPAYTLEELDQGLLRPDRLTIAPDLILAAGRLPNRPPSTIVDLTQWPPTILRQGAAEFPRSHSIIALGAKRE